MHSSPRPDLVFRKFVFTQVVRVLLEARADPNRAAADGNFFLRGFNHLLLFKKEREA